MLFARRNRHKWSTYFKILDELANKSNKAAICRACYEALGDEAKKITNKANLCYNHLKSCPYFALKYAKEELEEILQLDKEATQESDYESNEEENSTKKIKNTKDEDIVAAFKLANPAIQLPSRRKLSGSENSNDSDNKKVPSDIVKIIEDSMFWNDLKELSEILLPFCATLNKLQCESARLCDIMHAYAWMKLSIHLNSLSAPILGKWAVYYYTQWFDIRPKIILLELEDFLGNNSPFDAIPFDQFNGDIIKYWTFIKRGTHKELANLALQLFGICVNSASVERLFSTMGFLHSKHRNRLGYKKVLEMSQLRGKIIQECKLNAIKKSANQIHHPNIILPISSDSEENDLFQESDSEYYQVSNNINNDSQWQEIIENWLALLSDEQSEEDLDEVVYPATSHNAKWPLLQIFQDNIEQPASHNLLLGD
ncbi:15166_t:CDS:2 [Cetraspora pellucida]|uniref:15166_t:CDS:1 n=1 Tax=Cetraspora pellucida TaxID=1433469 RepID=A0ACA9LF19_9GLOM|nr:15166_t:CDS:2 [Cetraspora pellucida]